MWFGKEWEDVNNKSHRLSPGPPCSLTTPDAYIIIRVKIREYATFVSKFEGREKWKWEGGRERKGENEREEKTEG